MGPRYIGDGVYASFEEGMLKLSTPQQETVHTIYLEPAVMLELIKYWDELIEEAKKTLALKFAGEKKE